MNFAKFFFLTCSIAALATAISFRSIAGEGTHVGNGSPPKSASPQTVTEKVEGTGLNAEVVLDRVKKDVTVVSKAGALPAHVELKLKLKGGATKDVALKADPAPSKLSGKLEGDDAITGFELRFSADAKTWTTIDKNVAL